MWKPPHKNSRKNMKISRKPESHVRALSDGCSSPQKTCIQLPNRNSKIPDFGLTLASIDEFLLQTSQIKSHYAVQCDFVWAAILLCVGCNMDQCGFLDSEWIFDGARPWNVATWCTERSRQRTVPASYKQKSLVSPLLCLGSRIGYLKKQLKCFISWHSGGAHTI